MDTQPATPETRRSRKAAARQRRSRRLLTLATAGMAVVSAGITGTALSAEAVGPEGKVVQPVVAASAMTVPTPVMQTAPVPAGGLVQVVTNHRAGAYLAAAANRTPGTTVDLVLRLQALTFPEAGLGGTAPWAPAPADMPAEVRARAEAAMKYPNGRIPESLLCATQSGWLLRCDAAWRLDQLDEAFMAKFGRRISLIDAYRTFDGQVRSKKAFGHMAATPGTSNHGWGLAMDLTGPEGSSGTPEHAWLVDNAPAFGWWWPVWMRAGHEAFQLDEPWHFEYREGMDAGYIRIISAVRLPDGPPVGSSGRAPANAVRATASAKGTPATTPVGTTKTTGTTSATGTASATTTTTASGTVSGTTSASSTPGSATGTATVSGTVTSSSTAPTATGTVTATTTTGTTSASTTVACPTTSTVTVTGTSSTSTTGTTTTSSTSPTSGTETSGTSTSGTSTTTSPTSGCVTVTTTSGTATPRATATTPLPTSTTAPLPTSTTAAATRR